MRDSSAGTGPGRATGKTAPERKETLQASVGKLLMDMINAKNNGCAVMGHPASPVTYEFIATVYLPTGTLAFGPSQETRRVKITVETEE